MDFKPPDWIVIEDLNLLFTYNIHSQDATDCQGVSEHLKLKN